MRLLATVSLLIGMFLMVVGSDEATAEPTIWKASRDYDEWEERWKEPIVTTKSVRSRSRSYLMMWTWFYGIDRLNLMVIE